MNSPKCTGTKVCKTCGQEKIALAFAGNKKARDGLQASCRDCVATMTIQSPSAVARKKARVPKARLARWP